MTHNKQIKFIFLLLSVFIITACNTISYYGQAMQGQVDIWQRMQPIENVIAQTDTPTRLKQQLAEVLQIRAFASDKLYLPDNPSYTFYADLQRPYVVWNVFAAAPFSIKPQEWCFLVVGCVSYRGYFTEADAKQAASALQTEGYDVYVGGIAAYSTLGWFTDPLLNTMLSWSRTRIASVIFHELSHQLLYIPNDTAFNESFAMTVETIGVERWLAQNGTPAEWENYQQYRQRRADFIVLIQQTRTDLEQLYRSPLSQADKIAQKTHIFAQLQANYQQVKQQKWGGYAGYDFWFAETLNNAKITSILTYQDYIPAFTTLLSEKQGNLAEFYQAVKTLSQLSAEERQQTLNGLLARN
ncbi:aminopeptidase [Beggiatoa leptomitoformis]|uniref:Aminopeptidase n=1 Tax=Beggiatoa leptomitoformis TaxID=288004 RepID=A0A2N9YDK6_9GAMM|nr:aminopeptidase [Beggiatoa leptomitoformis]ALG69033.1 aminopeptidase [Beggiatoa leptomitoformis]AUI68563.1 aminopeptidase [Beggiatoa leptomitoformis]